MPVCPGCHGDISYERLNAHVRGCPWIWSDDPEERSALDRQLARRLEEIETRLDHLESEHH
ncbi:hypothetical protein [Halomicrococcus gelatinilyticus]|uniref:hypothetical protein n=1 Tax=Halomicrococcus gelatinilyticus TaxID=1702103 RepID=UPI002E0D4194